jgi:hypothetical protein
MTTPPAPRCAACRRRLKNPTTSGLGPVCEKRLHPSPHTTTAASSGPVPVPVIDGQVELPLDLHPHMTSPTRREAR